MGRFISQAGVDFETRPMVVVNASAPPDPKELNYDVLLQFVNLVSMLVLMKGVLFLEAPNIIQSIPQSPVFFIRHVTGASILSHAGTCTKLARIDSPTQPTPLLAHSMIVDIKHRASPTEWVAPVERAQSPTVSFDLYDDDDNSTIQVLPNELLTEIFRWTVGDASITVPQPSELDQFYAQSTVVIPLLISHVCRRWRYLAIATVWNRFQFFNPRWLSTYSLSHLEEVATHFLTLIPPSRRFEIQVLVDGEMPRGAFQSFVVGNAGRITGADLELTEEDLDTFWHLPEATFPVLRRLRLTFVASMDCDSAPTPEDSTTLSALAPHLTSFSYTAWDGEVDAFEFGLNFDQLQELELCARISEESAYELLPSITKIQSLALAIEANPYMEWHLGSRDEDEPDDHLDQVISVPDLLSTRSTETSDEDVITFEALTHLDMTFPCYEQLVTFIEQAKPLPLTSLTLRNNAVNGDNDPDIYNQGFHEAFLSWFSRYEIKLTCLKLYEMHNMSTEHFTAILSAHPQLAELSITRCFGTFWSIFTEAHAHDIRLLPNLTSFACTAFGRIRVDGLIAFISGHCSDSWPGARLQQVDFEPAFAITYRGSDRRGTERAGDRLLSAASAWHNQAGVQVTITCGSMEDRHAFTGHD
ncbi:hypothetical protein R3P38DRAFT_3257443 [Favolaschia claudopus]|uniref:F-box domain-containing protein n=1 Tax=Favolaschia claudopus TaxID=2862362 RepID=A0AAW0DBZ0_9AGAR